MRQLRVIYEGLPVGTLAEAPARGALGVREAVFFEYDPDFVRRGLELSPLTLPLGPGVRMRESVPTLRLPGLFEDSLPDRWGRRIMMEWFRVQGMPEENVSPLMMLSYVGSRGMGALRYEPEAGPSHASAVALDDLFAAAAAMEQSDRIDLDLLAEIGSSAGGAKPKALIALPAPGAAGPVVPGASEIPTGYEAWLIKFETEPASGKMEEAYARMARAAGIDLPPTRLLATNHGSGARHHFAVKRFDRESGKRIHHHTLAGMCQMSGGDMDYETLLAVTRRVTRDEREVLRAFRRAVFNVLAGNRDDHGKNHGFIFHHGEWKLGPAYDLTFSRLPERGMAVGGERRHAGLAHLRELANRAAMDRRDAADILDQVRDAIARWREFATAAGVPEMIAAETDAVLRALAG